MTIPFVSPALLADPPTPSGETALVNARLFEGTGADVVDGATVVIKDGTVTSDQPSNEAKVIDLEGRFLMPGLIDAHAHLAEQITVEMTHGMEPLRAGVKGHLVASAVQQALRMGITTVRDVGAVGDTLLEVRQAMRQGAFLGPPK